MANQHSEFTWGEDVYPGQFPAKVEDDTKIPHHQRNDIHPVRWKLQAQTRCQLLILPALFVLTLKDERLPSAGDLHNPNHSSVVHSLNNDHLDPFSRSSCPFRMAQQCLSLALATYATVSATSVDPQQPAMRDTIICLLIVDPGHRGSAVLDG